MLARGHCNENGTLRSEQVSDRKGCLGAYMSKGHSLFGMEVPRDYAGKNGGDAEKAVVCTSWGVVVSTLQSSE